MVWTHDKRLGGLQKWSGCMTQPEEPLLVPEIRLLISSSLLTDNKCSVSCHKQTVNCLLSGKGEKKKVRCPYTHQESIQVKQRYGSTHSLTWH